MSATCGSSKVLQEPGMDKHKSELHVLVSSHHLWHVQCQFKCFKQVYTNKPPNPAVHLFPGLSLFQPPLGEKVRGVVGRDTSPGTFTSKVHLEPPVTPDGCFWTVGGTRRIQREHGPSTERWFMLTQPQTHLDQVAKHNKTSLKGCRWGNGRGLRLQRCVEELLMSTCCSTNALLHPH